MPLLRKTLMVDSRDRNTSLYPEPNNYRVNLPAVYKRIHSIRLRTIELPNSFYNFSPAQQNVTLGINLNGDAKTITLPSGNYSLNEGGTTDLLQALQAAILAAYNIQSTAFTVVLNPVSARVVFSSTVPFTLDTATSAIDGKTYYGLGYFLGLPKSNALASVGNVITSSFYPQASPNNYILMELDLLNSVDELALEGKASGNVNGAFAKIVIDNNPGEYLVQNDLSNVLGEIEFMTPREKLTNLLVRFRFHDGKDVDFNRIDHSFSLELLYEL
jgi:hypothetical protein